MTENLYIAVLGTRPNALLDDFLRAKDFTRFPPSDGRAKIADRREEMVDAFLASGLPRMLMMDDDALPALSWACIYPLLTSDADVAGAESRDTHGTMQHPENGGFACCALTLTRRAVQYLRMKHGRVFQQSRTECECSRLYRICRDDSAAPWLHPVVAGQVVNGNADAGKGMTNAGIPETRA
jgi:hypothetical protein